MPHKNVAEVQKVLYPIKIKGNTPNNEASDQFVGDATGVPQGGELGSLVRRALRGDLHRCRHIAVPGRQKKNKLKQCN